jgi:hypothetical protein
VVDVTKNASEIGVSVNVAAHRISRWFGYLKKQSFHVLQVAHTTHAEDGNSGLLQCKLTFEPYFAGRNFLL